MPANEDNIKENWKASSFGVGSSKVGKLTRVVIYAPDIYDEKLRDGEIRLDTD